MIPAQTNTRFLGVGDALPDLSLPLVGSGNGSESLSFGDLRGKHVLLYMWASW